MFGRNPAGVARRLAAVDPDRGAPRLPVHGPSYHANSGISPPVACTAEPGNGSFEAPHRIGLVTLGIGRRCTTPVLADPSRQAGPHLHANHKLYRLRRVAGLIA